MGSMEHPGVFTSRSRVASAGRATTDGERIAPAPDDSARRAEREQASTMGGERTSLPVERFGMRPDLRAVLDNPLDDRPRLAFADALGDDPRAEHIRLQVRRRYAGGCTPRERALWLANREAWLAPVKPLVEVAGFARGFVEHASMSAEQWLKNAAALLALAPIIDLHLTGAAGRAEIYAVPELRRMRSLSLAHNQLSDADAETLAASAHVRGLKWLDLTNNRIGRSGLDAIAASPNLPALRWLGFAHNAVEDPVSYPAMDGSVVCAVVTPLIQAEIVAKVGRKPWLEARDGDTPPGWWEV